MTRRLTQRSLAAAIGFLLIGAALAHAAGLANFTLTRAIPADAQVVMQCRDHDGRAFVNTQYDRLWAEIEKQNFGRDLRRLFQNMAKQSGGDPNEFDVNWQRINDLAAVVEWNTLAKREFAFAMKLAPPLGGEFIFLLMPPAERVGPDFDGLVGLLKGLVGLAPPGVFELSEDGAGESRLCKVALAAGGPPLSLMLAREGETILVGVGSALPEQALALLKGESDASATLAASARFKKAMGMLPPPTDGYVFVDIAQIMAQTKVFAQMAAQAAALAEPNANAAPPDPHSDAATNGGSPEVASDEPSQNGAGTQPAAPPAVTPGIRMLAALPALVRELEVWEFAAEVSTTDGMKTESHGVTVLRPGAAERGFGKVLYGNPPIDKPFRYIPKEATSVGVNSGFSWAALYRTVVDFVEREVPDGPAMIEQWNTQKQALPYDVEAILGWLGGEYASFSAPIPTPFMPGSVYVLPVRDPGKAAAFIEQVSQDLNTALKEQNAGVEDAKIEGADGFKRVILPPLFAMVPGLGRPIYGLKDGNLIVGNGPEVVGLAMKVASGGQDDFSKNERYQAEGLPIIENMTAFTFADLSRMGDELSQMFAMVGLLQSFSPELRKDPVAMSALGMLAKVSNVLKKLDFFKSSCAIKTFKDNAEHSHTIVNYQEPPRPKTTTTPAPADEPAPAEEPAAEPAKSE